MIEPDSHRDSLSTRIVLGIGLLLTVGMFSGYRPWGNSPVNIVFLFGPVLLAAGAASHFAHRVDPEAAKGSLGRSISSARRVTGLGLLMLLVGGCPWLYTPFLFGGESNTSSGMLGTIIFLLIGFSGLAVTMIGFVNLARERRSRALRVPSPLAPEPGAIDGHQANNTSPSTHS